MQGKNYVNLMPSPSSLMESMRDIGYSMDTAAADLIDNSITAGSQNIEIQFSWNAGNPWIAIADDGCGMTKDELIAAMRFGSTNPLDRREAEDLGRFGLGLKTASISQCRRLTVVSKRGLEVSACEWDLDQVQSSGDGEWCLGVLGQQQIQERPVLHGMFVKLLKQRESGTLVLWQRFDRLEEYGAPIKRERAFNASLAGVRKHLELVFHRYISPDRGKRRLFLRLNGDELTGFNPFHPGKLATQELPVQRFHIEGQEVVVQPYILPHHSKISRRDYDKYAGDEGYLHNQGFYVYRNRRLIIKGTWFRLMKKAELSKLLRVRVDIPNTLDHLWKIDVKKSAATPPASVREQLKQIIQRIELQGKKVYKQKGQRLTTRVQTPAWHRRARGGSISYEINRQYPPLRQLLSLMDNQQCCVFESLIATLEQSFPRDLFFHDVADTPEKVQPPETDPQTLETILDQFLSFWSDGSQANENVADRILAAEPFSSNREASTAILKARGLLP